MAQGLTPEELEVAKQTCRTAGFVIEKELGRGAFGVVYKAVRSGTFVAIKVLSKSFFSAPHVKPYLEREVQLQMRVAHPNVVRLYQLLEDAHSIEIVMEYCDCSLEDYLQRAEGRRLSEAETRGFARQLAAGIKVLYDAKIAHRDLKPANILMTRTPAGSWILKIADFGFAKHAEALVTKLGTPIFSAPEVRTGKYGAEVDLWSIGAILYQCLEGCYHVQASSVPELEAKLTSPNPPRFELPTKDRSYSQNCRDLVSGLLTKNLRYRMDFQRFFTHPFVMPAIRFVAVSGSDAALQLPVSSATIESGDYVPLVPPRNFVLTWQPLLAAFSEKLRSGTSGRTPSPPPPPVASFAVFFDGRFLPPTAAVEFVAPEMTVLVLKPSSLPQPTSEAIPDISAFIPSAIKREEFRATHALVGNETSAAIVENQLVELQLLVCACRECFDSLSRFIAAKDALVYTVFALAEQLRDLLRRARHEQADIERVISLLSDAIYRATPRPATGPHDRPPPLLETDLDLPDESSIDDGSGSSGPTNLVEAKAEELVAMVTKVLEESRASTQDGSHEGLSIAARKLPGLLAITEKQLTESHASLVSVYRSYARSWNRLASLVASSTALAEYVALLPPLREAATKANEDLFRRAAPVRTAASEHAVSFHQHAVRHAAAVRKILERTPPTLLRIKEHAVEAASAAPASASVPKPPPSPPPTRDDVQRLREQLSRALGEAEELRKQQDAAKASSEDATRRLSEQLAAAQSELGRARAHETELAASLEARNVELRAVQDRIGGLEQQVAEQTSLIQFFTAEYQQSGRPAQ